MAIPLAGLPQDKGKFIVGCRHKLDKVWHPDITIYFVEDQSSLEDMIDSMRDPNKNHQYVVALMELKYRNSLDKDLHKLQDMQHYIQDRAGRNVLCWMAYGDHFRSDVHEHNFQSQVERERDIRKWVAESPTTRGCTILKLGVSKPGDSNSAHTIRRAFNERFWRRDKLSKRLSRIPL